MKEIYISAELDIVTFEAEDMLRHKNSRMHTEGEHTAWSAVHRV